MNIEFDSALPIFILIAGFVIGQGAVTVIDLLGFLGTKSSYWTEATIRSHKVTKPLIWIGMILVMIGLFLTYSKFGAPSFVNLQVISIIAMILNGCFLSFYISPALLKQEKEGRSTQLLSNSMQMKIAISFIISFTCWWGNLALTSIYLANKI